VQPESGRQTSLPCPDEDVSSAAEVVWVRYIAAIRRVCGEPAVEEVVQHINARFVVAYGNFSKARGGGRALLIGQVSPVLTD